MVAKMTSEFGALEVSATPVARPTAALVKAPNNRKRKGLTIAEAAREAKVSPATVYSAISKGILPARRRGKMYVIARDVFVQIAPQLRLRAAPGRAEVMEIEGERDSRVVARFQRGVSVADIVEQERIPIATVLELRRLWIEGRRADTQDIDFRCGCGAPADLHTARCAACAAQTRVLSDEQRMILAGQTVPVACRCTGCGTVSGEGLCGGCVSLVDVVADGGGLVISVGGKAVRRMSAAEVRALVPARPVPVAEAPATASAPRGAPVDASLAEAFAGLGAGVQGPLPVDVEAARRETDRALEEHNRLMDELRKTKKT
jgi:hypothetical protein